MGPARLALPEQNEAPFMKTHRRHALESRRAGLPVEKVSEGDLDQVTVLRKIFLPQDHEPLRLADGKRAQEERVHHGEGDQARSDGRSESDDHGRGDGRFAPQRATGLENVAEKRGHGAIV